MEVYAVTIDDVVYFKSIKDARESAKKWLAKYKHIEYVDIWKCADYDAEDEKCHYPYETIEH